MYSDFFANLASPPVLFFVLGFAAVLVRSDLTVPDTIAKALSLYLLFAIGFKGGVGLGESGLGGPVAGTLFAAVAMASLVPVYAFFLLRRYVTVENAAALAATYGSISAVTFITATAFLQRQEIPFGGHMIAAMALMESPAIVVGILLLRRYQHGKGKVGWRGILHEALLNGSVLLLMGSMAIGLVTSEAGRDAMRPFYSDIFNGVLCFFLLDMGIVAARRIRALPQSGRFLFVFAVALPLFNAAVAVPLVWLLGLGPGDALLFLVLCASASYIAVPAAFRMAVPEANPSIYVTPSLAITFPFNIIVGIPLYHELAQFISG
jgi:hypothetical protein